MYNTHTTLSTDATIHTCVCIYGRSVPLPTGSSEYRDKTNKSKQNGCTLFPVHNHNAIMFSIRACVRIYICIYVCVLCIGQSSGAYSFVDSIVCVICRCMYLCVIVVGILWLCVCIHKCFYRYMIRLRDCPVHMCVCMQVLSARVQNGWWCL